MPKPKPTIVVLDGQDWEVPVLTAGVLEDEEGAYQAIMSAAVARKQPPAGALISLLTAALRDRYPDITRERVRGMVRISDMPAVYAALMSGSGVKQKEEPGETEPGEASR